MYMYTLRGNMLSGFFLCIDNNVNAHWEKYSRTNCQETCHQQQRVHLKQIEN